MKRLSIATLFLLLCSLFLLCVQVKTTNPRLAGTERLRRGCASREEAQNTIFAFDPVSDSRDGNPDKSHSTGPVDSAMFADSIWGEFRNENPHRFHEILNGFETKGAVASINLFVCDEEGRPVPDASVRLSFSTPAGLDHDKRIFGGTDETGHFLAEERSIWQVGWRVEKEGYYTAYSNLVLRPYATVRGWEERRWFRSAFPATAILRRKTPHDMVFRRIKVQLPPRGEKLGFDLVEGKPTPPHGDGQTSDIVFYEEREGNWSPKSTEDRFSSVHIEFPGEGNGAMVFPMDNRSDLKSPRQAPENGYLPAMESVSRVRDGHYTDTDQISPNVYLVVRIRSSMLKNGEFQRPIYGKIRGEWYVNGSKRLISFRTWMNEEAGNSNLEDTSGWW